ncbi:hypothetical protein QE152_g22082 [Popillia japonica]|uniref:Uncharacterized protein n=1 Tax=Popillia japonica TaxID=7064 RepID=A0AAW1KK04_POPJA
MLLLPLIPVKQKLLSEDDQQELTEVRIKLQQISSDNHQHYETLLSEWIDAGEKLLPLHSDDSVSSDKSVIDEPRVKHEETISSFNTCIKWAEENGAELGTLHTLRLLRTEQSKT